VKESCIILTFTEKELHTFKQKLHQLSNAGNNFVSEETIVHSLAKYSIHKLTLSQALAIANRRVSVLTEEE
jgi:cell division septal protein FtsQ